MPPRTSCGGAILAALLIHTGCQQAPAFDPAHLQKLRLPEGFTASIYADQVPDARSLARGAGGTLFVGTRQKGSVYALVDQDQDQHVDQVHVLATGLRMPNGVAVRDGALYVAEVHRVLRFDDIEQHLADPPRPVVVNDSLPRDRWHGWKFIRFGPDGQLYVPVGAPCNVCLRDDPRYSSILRMQPDKAQFEVFAGGIRNTVGFDWHPQTRELWFTENGRDELGDDTPPDELNIAPRPGMHFGFPFVHGTNVADPEYASVKPAALETTPPVAEFTAHCAALGMRFYTGTMFPEKYRGAIFVAQHGSWNRYDLPPSGYQIQVVYLEGNRVKSVETFAEGWLEERAPWGRPVDVEVMPDGALLVSDDHAGVVYRIAYAGNPTPARNP